LITKVKRVEIMPSNMQLSKEELRETKLSRDEYLTKPKIPLIVVLDNVTNSYNIGAFIRLADAFAIEKVIVCGTGALSISDKKMKKASRNEAKWVTVEYKESTVDTLNQLLADNYAIYSVELCHESVDYATIAYPAKTVLVLGNERKGVSEAALALSDQHIHIPMFGMGNSLNVSTAGAIVLAECANQIRHKL
jgi:tRNA G18 (ribose-2'-O)-methylase SpoU